MSDHIETATSSDAFNGWSEELLADMRKNEMSGIVGSTLVSETETLRVWHLTLAPGQRCAFHRHVNPYFWSAHRAGMGRSYFSDGRIVDGPYYAGETRHYHYGKGEYMVHSIENIGDSDLVFTTVEFLTGENEPLPIPNHVRLKPPAEAA